MKILKRTNGKAFARALRTALGTVDGNEMIVRFAARYDKLCHAQNKYTDGTLHRHLKENILPGVALYQVLLDDPSTRDRALDLIEQAFTEWAGIARNRMERLGRWPFFFNLLRYSVKFMMRMGFPSPGFDVEWVAVDNNQIAFNMKRCFYLTALTEYGMPELTPQYCRFDDVIYADVSPYVAWKRTDTLARGGACCDFRFEKISKP